MSTNIAPDFLPWLESEIKSFADDFGCSQERAFPAWTMKFIHEIDEDTAFNQTDTLSNGDAGIDGWFYDKKDSTFHLIQAKYLKDKVNSCLNPSDLDVLIKGANYLQDPVGVADGPHQEKLTPIAMKLAEAIADGASISLDIYLAGRITDESWTIFETAVKGLGENFMASLYDTKKLCDLRLSDDPISNLANETVNFKLTSKDSYYDSMVKNINIPGIVKAAVVTIDGRSVGDAVANCGPRLFHGNVRYYLRRRNKINQEMIKTLSTPEGRRSFWLFNNGLTMVADSFSIIGDELQAVNPQIVNGAQTSSVLHDCRAIVGMGDVAVQCRVIAISPDPAGASALQKISSYTNSQSPVKVSDLGSNSSRQKKIQASFNLLPQKIFYERRRGEWMSLPVADRKRIYANRMVTKEDVGQRFLAYSGRPSESISKKESIYDEFESIAFDSNISANIYMLAYELYEQGNHLLKMSSSNELIGLVPSFKNPVDPSNEQGITLLDSIRSARGLVCMHSLALAKEALQWKYGSIGLQRAETLRTKIVEADKVLYSFIWRYVFRTIRMWVSGLSDKSRLKSELQKTDAFINLKSILLDNLAEVDKNSIPNL